MFTKKGENRIIRGGIIIFWLSFWLFNAIDKAVLEPRFIWVGENWVSLFLKLFGSIGIENKVVPYLALSLVGVLEFTAAVFMILALFYYFKGEKKKTKNMFFIGILISLIIFSFFAIGDQIFGERQELLEHSTYWIGLIISWFIYTKLFNILYRLKFIIQQNMYVFHRIFWLKDFKSFTLD